MRVKALRVAAILVELAGAVTLGGALYLSLACDGCGYFVNPAPLLIPGTILIMMGSFVIAKVKL